MKRSSSEGIDFTSVHRRVLQELTINESSPGTILRDFGALLDYLRNGDMAVTGSHQFPLRLLPEINALLAHPIQQRLKRPMQKSYPHIQGLYLLLRASGLTRVGGTGKNPLLLVDQATYQAWSHLNPTERYGILLESWLLRGKPEIIGERGRGLFLIPDNFRNWKFFFDLIPDRGLQVADNRDAELCLRYIPGWHNFALMELFGMITVQHGLPEAGKGWRVERVYRTPLGNALLVLIYTGFFRSFDNIENLEDRGTVPYGVLQPVLQPYLAEWHNNLSVPEWEFRDGTYLFKVSLGQIWFRIAIPAAKTLEELAYAILTAVDFDDDHLYQFSYENRFGAQEKVYHPDMNEKPGANQILVGDLPLGIGQTMEYLFDFGDQWLFNVTLEQVDRDRVVKKPAIVEIHGEPPEQYPEWND